MRITKVYTRTGDAGKTSLVSGDRVSKADLRVSAYGDVDELNSVLGVVRTGPLDVELSELLGRLQNDLFTVGADLATPAGTPVPRVSPEMVTELEQVIDKYLEELEPLKEFILPGGSSAGAMLHLARTVARRAERVVVALAEREEITAEALQYLNRLSDLLFVLARAANKRAGTVEQSAQFSQRHQRRTEAK